MSASEILKSVQFLMDAHGQPSAVQLDLETWKSLLDWVEDFEDRAVARQALERLRKGPPHAGALEWETVGPEWDSAGPDRA